MPSNPYRDDERALQHLRDLAELLHSDGLKTELKTPEGRIPSLKVTAPGIARMSELVVVDQGAGGDWFLYSWAERVARVDQLEQTAERIAHVLGIDDNTDP